MSEPNRPPSPAAQGSPTRRAVLHQAGLVGLTGAGAGLLAGCGASGAATDLGGDQPVLRIGYVSPITGAAAGSGDVDNFVLQKFTAALGSGLAVGGTTYRVQLELRDSESTPAHATQVAKELIASGVDLMLAHSTPETVNQVANACEAARVPCLTTVCPWEAYYFGRGATPGKPFTYTYHFYFGNAQSSALFKSLWLSGLPNNHRVGVLWPDDADGAAVRKSLGPELSKAGVTIVDPGAFPDGTQDFSPIIASFIRQRVDLLTSVALPPDFARFWRQATEQGFRPKIATIAKTALLPSQVEALGDPGLGLTTGVRWHPSWPTSSNLLGLTSQQLADVYEQQTRQQWTMDLGSAVALVETAIHALSASGAPKDRKAVAKALSTTVLDTVVGRLDWTRGPVKNVAIEPLIGGQWVRATQGRFALDIRIVDNSGFPAVKIQAKDSQLAPL